MESPAKHMQKLVTARDLVPALPRRYRVVKALGRGGQGAVFLGFDRYRDDAPVAIKIALCPRPEDVQRLSAEFLTLRQLLHPRIARVRDFGTLDGGSAYFTSDFIHGGNLLEWSEGVTGESRWDGLLKLAFQATAALRYLAIRGVRHGDIKPANLLIEGGASEEACAAKNPALRVIDFGAASLRSTAPRHALEEHGTPVYLPPPGLAGESLDPDLYGLAMSLFHAGAGRLPFPLGDASAARAWKERGGALDLKAFEPTAPDVLCELLARSSAPGSGGRFSSAAEAMELLKDRVAPGRLEQDAPREALDCVIGRDAELDRLLQRVLPSAGRSAPLLQLVTAPRGSGKTALLETLTSRLQVHDVRCVSFCGAGDGRAEGKLREVVAEISGSLLPSSGTTENLAAEAASRLAEHGARSVALLLDEGPEEAERPDLLLKSLLPCLRRGKRGFAVPIIAAAGDAAAFARRFGLRSAEIEVHPLEPLSRESIRDVVREFFCVESVSGRIIEQIALESGGAPPLVREALSRLSEAGVSGGSLGHLRIPHDLPPRLLSPGRGPSGRLHDLPRSLKQALGVLLAAGEPLDATLGAARFQALDVGLWQRRLESLRALGLVRREAGELGLLYIPALPLGETSVRSLLGERLERRVREELATFHERVTKPRYRPPPDTLAAAARNFAAIGDLARAARYSLRAARALRRQGRLADTVDLFRVLLPALCPAVPLRLSAALRIRAAQSFRRLGECSAALQALEPLDAAGAGRRPFPWICASLRAQILEEMGQPARAISEIEMLVSAGSDAHGVVDDPTHLEAQALLASLYFRSGRQKEGAACLEAGRRALERLEALERQDPAQNGLRVRYADACTRFAGAEARHGERRSAVSHLEMALSLSRRGGRPTMRREALNEIAILYAEQRNWDGALRAFEEMESFARGLSDRTGVLEAVFNRAVIHYKRHDLDRAEDLFREARRISEEFGTHVLAPTVWLGLAGVFRERGSLLEAMRLYRRLLRSDTSLSRPNDSCVAHSNLAEIHLVLGRLDRALRHVHVARRLARSTRSRFAFTLAVRVSGMVHWALGADSRAQRDLEKALAMAREAGDSRGQGMAEHYLGRLASVRGHTAEAFRRLRRGTASSRSASDRVHLHAGVLALLAELVALGRRSGPARLLESYATKKTGWARGDLLARVLAEELDDAWPENSGRVEVLCQQAAREGSVWDAFCALGEALRGPRLPAATSQALAFQRDRLAMSILRRVPARHVRGFLRFWKLPPELAPSSLAGEAGEDPLERNPPRREAASGPSVAGPLLLVGETLEPLAESTSLALETALDVSLGRSEALALGILFDPHLDDKACTFRGRGEHSLSSLSGRHAEAITRARGSTRIVESPPFLFHRLAHPKAARVLCGEFRVIDARARQSLRDAATFMALAIRLAELHRDLAHERARHGDARDELRRLNTLAVKGSLQELETAVMTQRIELLDLKQKLLERQEELRKAHRRPAAPPPASASPAMKRILEGLPAMAARDLPVLILGESGVGKDVLARWIHELGPRREKPYISEVANLVESLAEAELFGFAAGAFTGAVDDRPGILELARGGTVYLDEIATLPPAIQGKLLRVLEEKRVRPIGAEESVSVDFRLLSSSRHTLAELQGLPGLRQDLLYRVNAEVVEVPPLRERPEDILALTDQFIDDCCHESGQQPPYMHEEVRDRLLEHSWPGNVRELRNEIQRLLATRPPEITAEMLRLQARPVAPAMGASGAALPTLRQERSRVEERLLRRALESSGGNASAASRRLGITRRYLGTLLRKHRIRLGTKTGKAGPRRNDQL